jgi:hypothetical protein
MTSSCKCAPQLQRNEIPAIRLFHSSRAHQIRCQETSRLRLFRAGSGRFGSAIPPTVRQYPTSTLEKLYSLKWAYSFARLPPGSLWLPSTLETIASSILSSAFPRTDNFPGPHSSGPTRSPGYPRGPFGYPPHLRSPSLISSRKMPRSSGESTQAYPAFPVPFSLPSAVFRSLIFQL